MKCLCSLHDISNKNDVKLFICVKFTEKKCKNIIAVVDLLSKKFCNLQVTPNIWQTQLLSARSKLNTYVTKNIIFGLKMMVKSGLEKFVLKIKKGVLWKVG